MVLHKGDGGLGALYHIFFHIPAAGDGGLRFQGVLNTGVHGHFFTDHNVRAHPHGEAHQQAQEHLADKFAAFRHPFLVVFEHLNIVIGKAQSAAPEGAHHKQLHVDVGKVAEQQHTREDGHNDDDAAHRGGPFLLDLSFQAQVAHGLADLQQLQTTDDALPREHGYQHGRHRRQHGTERQVVHEADAGEIDTDGIQVSEQMINHWASSLKVSATISFSSKWFLVWPIIW